MVGRSCFWELELGWLGWWRVLDWAADLVYLADCLVRGHEGYREQGLLVRDSVLLRRRYLAQPGRWIPDILRLAGRSVDCCALCTVQHPAHGPVHAPAGARLQGEPPLPSLGQVQQDHQARQAAGVPRQGQQKISI